MFVGHLQNFFFFWPATGVSHIKGAYKRVDRAFISRDVGYGYLRELSDNKVGV